MSAADEDWQTVAVVVEITVRVHDSDYAERGMAQLSEVVYLDPREPLSGQIAETSAELTTRLAALMEGPAVALSGYKPPA